MLNLTTWVLSLLIALGAPERVTPPADLAPAIAAAAEAHPMPGERGVERAAVVLSVTAFEESRYDASARGKAGEVGSFQLMPWWKPGKTIDEQARQAAALLVESFRVCRARPLSERLAHWFQGNGACSTTEPLPAVLARSRYRMGKAARLLRDFPPPVREEAVASAP